MECEESSERCLSASRVLSAVGFCLFGFVFFAMTSAAQERPFIIEVAIPKSTVAYSHLNGLKEELADVAEVRLVNEGRADSAVDSVLKGGVDIAVVPVSALTALIPALGIYELSFSYRSSEGYWFSREDELSEKALKQLQEKNLEALGGIWYGGNKVFVSRLPRRSPQDFKDALVAVSDNSVMPGWSDVGAKTVLMSDSQMVAALAAGRVDAAELPYAALWDLHSGYVTRSDHRFVSLLAIRKSGAPARPVSAQTNERIVAAIQRARQLISDETRDGETPRGKSKTPDITWLDLKNNGRTEWQKVLANSERTLIQKAGFSGLAEFRDSVSDSIKMLASDEYGAMASASMSEGVPLSINWNAWFQSSANNVKHSLEVNKRYDFVLDLGRGFYPGALGGAISSILDGEIASQASEAEIHLLVRPILLGPTLRAAPNTTLKAQDLVVHMDRLGSKENDEGLREKVRQKTLSLNELANALSVDKPLVWPVVAQRAGCAQVALSIWDATGLRPLDYIVVSVPVNKRGESRDECDTGLTGGSLVSGVDRLMDLGRSQTGGVQADAALHLFDSVPAGEGQPTTVAVLIDRAKHAADGTVYAWELGSDWKQFQNTMLPNSVANTHKRLRSSQPYGQVVQQISNALFNGRDSDDQAVADAAQATLKLLGARKDNPVLLVRYFDPWGEMQTLPLGLLGANAPKRLFAERVTVVQPLQDALQADPGNCFRDWDFAIPQKLDDVSADSAELLMKDDWRIQGADIRWYRSNNDLLDFVVQPGTNEQQTSSALVLLAHYGNGGITFTKNGLPDQVLSSDIKRHFVPGSIAILAACSTLGAGAADRTFVNMLIDRGVGAVIASPFFVDSDFGTRLAVSFVAVAKELRAGAGTPSLMDVFNLAMQKTIDTYGRDSGYADMALEFQIVGDPHLQMCKTPLVSEQIPGEQP